MRDLNFCSIGSSDGSFSDEEFKLPDEMDHCVEWKHMGRSEGTVDDSVAHKHHSS